MMAENFTENVNMNGVDTLTAYFDNPMTGIQLPTNSEVADMDELLSDQPPFKLENDTSPPEMRRSPSDVDLEYQEFHLEDMPSLAGESDTDLSYHSSSSEIDSHDESHEHDELSAIKNKYRQPASLRSVNLTIGPWKLTDPMKPAQGADQFTLEVKFLFGRRKIKYDFFQTSSKKSLILDYEFSQISALKFKPKERLLIFQLSEAPFFSSKERGKCNKVPDFTQGNASRYQTHLIELAPNVNYEEQFEKLLQSDRRLRQLSEIALPAIDSTFSNVDELNSVPSVVCDWDKENSAVVYCGECNANYCEDCDDVLHRHATRKNHKRLPVSNSLAKPKKCKKRKKNDRCRCGTGATKGTLGDPCTGNRCPCYSNGKSCSNCGCKNCNNPYKKKAPSSGSSILCASRDSPLQLASPVAPVQL